MKKSTKKKAASAAKIAGAALAAGAIGSAVGGATGAGVGAIAAKAEQTGNQKAVTRELNSPSIGFTDSIVLNRAPLDRGLNVGGGIGLGAGAVLGGMGMARRQRRAELETGFTQSRS
jgi:hypothetical protein